MQRARILVIDDEQSVCRALARVLRHHDVESVTRARAGLERLDIEPPIDLVLCDLMMAAMTGMEFHAALVARGDGIEKRVIYMTGGAFTDEGREFLHGLANGAITKPFDLVKLRTTVDRTLEALAGHE